ncbi:MAG: hypothetical protein A3G81_00155 [Betaproteobacteria bacterium RIFCSPLOWO2_12_FULL_65_14]|nr:MAG: hypothetical protein A3G81_00155 [Betaproteobacteria bacterium RIFCSPLOWO2_12_FULL_65_14]
MSLRGLCLLLLCCLASTAWSADGLVAVKSHYAPKETIDRLEKLLKEKGMTVFARVDHAAGASKVGKTLRPTELLIFGNPQGGTPLMECAQSAGIDLPMKAMAWEDAKGQSWLGYNDPAWIARRHKAPKCAAAANLKKALASFINAAAAR